MASKNAIKNCAIRLENVVQFWVCLFHLKFVDGEEVFLN